MCASFSYLLVEGICLVKFQTRYKPGQRQRACCAQVLIVHGEGDALVPAWNSRRLAAGLPGARLVELARCGHMPMEEAPARFMDALADFAAELRSGGDE